MKGYLELGQSNQWLHYQRKAHIKFYIPIFRIIYGFSCDSKGFCILVSVSHCFKYFYCLQTLDINRHLTFIFLGFFNQFECFALHICVVLQRSEETVRFPWNKS